MQEGVVCIWLLKVCFLIFNLCINGGGVCAHEGRCHGKPEEEVRSPAASYRRFVSCPVWVLGAKDQCVPLTDEHLSSPHRFFHLAQAFRVDSCC